jgi:hypothetical protein
MATDQQVTARAVLRAVARLQRQGDDGSMRLLEHTEPDAAEYVMETLPLVHQRLAGLGGSVKKTRRLYEQVRLLVSCASSPSATPTTSCGGSRWATDWRSWKPVGMKSRTNPDRFKASCSLRIL